MSDEKAKMTEADTVAAVNALHRWLHSQDFNLNEALTVMALESGALLGSVARRDQWTAKQLTEIIDLVQQIFLSQVNKSLRGAIDNK
ncbi:MAG TPA: hypothetical protein VF748_14625 [Candidatus Acidoferrum sp.]